MQTIGLCARRTRSVSGLRVLPFSVNEILPTVAYWYLPLELPSQLLTVFRISYAHFFLLYFFDYFFVFYYGAVE